MENESPSNVNDKENAKLWEEKLKIPGLTMYMKKGGSELSSEQPYMRNEVIFDKEYKMDKIL